jgi:hypothetical protein
MKSTFGLRSAAETMVTVVARQATTIQRMGRAVHQAISIFL